MASKQPWRSDLTSDLKFMAQTTYASMFVWTDLAVLKLFLHLFGKKEERRKKKEEFVSTRPVGFANVNIRPKQNKAHVKFEKEIK